MFGNLRRRMREQSQRGAALPLIAGASIALLGAAALSLDIGQIALAKRRAQNAADAGALAGAARLPASSSGAITDARTRAVANGFVTTEIASAVTSTDMTNDTITTTITRDVNLLFAPIFNLLGGDHSISTVVAQSRVVTSQVTSVNTGQGGAFPYAVWGGNEGGVAALTAGTTVTYRSNKYDQVNVKTRAADVGKPSCEIDFPGPNVFNCNWNINSANFRGYFHWKDGWVHIDYTDEQVFSQGGNAYGTDLEDELTLYEQRNIPVWLPVVDYADDDTYQDDPQNIGNPLHFKLVTFVCVDLNPIPNASSQDWTAIILSPSAPGCAKGIGRPTGGVLPPSPITTVLGFKMTQ